MDAPSWTEAQRLLHGLWSLTALGLTITALVIDPLGTISRFSYWNLIFHFVVFGYLAFGFVDHHRPAQHPLTALAWAVLWLYAIMILLVMIIIACLDTNDTAALDAGGGIGNTLAAAYVWEFAVHGLPFLALFLVIGLPLAQVRAFVTTLTAGAILILYNLFLLAIGTNAAAVYNITNAGQGHVGDAAAAGGAGLAFLFSAIFSEVLVSDLLSAGDYYSAASTVNRKLTVNAA